MSPALEEKNSVTLSRTFAAPRERVFAAWTEPEQIVRWFGPEGCRVIGAEIDVRVGGAYRIRIASDKYGEMAVGGHYREVTPPAKLAYTWQWEDDPDYAERETLVTVEFLAAGDSTEIRLTHENLPSAESSKNHEHGWSGCLDKLDQLLAA